MTGEHVVVANTHILPDNTLEDRVEYRNKHLAALQRFAKTMKKRDLPMLITMDANINLRKPDNQKLFEGFDIIWVERGFPDSGTHGDGERVIDGIMDTDSSTTKLSPEAVTKWPDSNGSDHYPTLGIYSLNRILNEISPAPSETSSE